QEGRVDDAGTIVYNVLRHGGDARQAVAALGHALLNEDAEFHWFQTYEAAVQQFHAWPAGSNEGALILARMPPFLAPPPLPPRHPPARPRPPPGGPPRPPPTPRRNPLRDDLTAGRRSDPLARERARLPHPVGELRLVQGVVLADVQRPDPRRLGLHLRCRI